MPPMTTRSRWTPFWACLLTGALTGCDDSNIDGGSSSCTEAFDPPEPVSETLEKFRVGDQDFPNDLAHSRTALYSFIQAVEPETSSNGDEPEALAERVRELTQPFIQSKGELPDYESVRNPFDLIESLVSSDHFQAFREARNAMRHCRDEGEQGNFDINNVTLKTQTDDDSEAEPERWNASVLWSNNPNTGDEQDDFLPLPNITRLVITESADFILTLHDPDEFSATGFNTPMRLEAIFNRAGRVDPETLPDTDDEDEHAGASDEPSLLFASLRDMDYDEWEWSAPEDNPESITLNGNEMEALCIEVRLEYGSNELTFRASESSCRGRDRDEDEKQTYTTAGHPQTPD